MVTKICKICQREQLESQFNFSNKTKGYRKPYCKRCEHKKYLDKYETNAGLYKENSKSWQEKNREKYLNYQKTYNLKRRKIDNDKEQK